MSYLADAGWAAFGITSSTVGVGLAADGFLPGLSLLALGAYLTSYALFSGVETAVCRGRDGSPDDRAEFAD